MEVDGCLGRLPATKGVAAVARPFVVTLGRLACSPLALGVLPCNLVILGVFGLHSGCISRRLPESGWYGVW